MQAGQRRHYISIEQVAESQDARGELTKTWTEYANAWSEIKPVRGREYFQAHAENVAADTRIILPYLSGITSKMRVRFGSRIYDIETVINIDERNRELNLMCVEHT